jgi:conjugal transfer pilin signal peptidase TrbI
MPPATEPPIPASQAKSGSRARWLVIGVIGTGLAASSGLSEWRDEHAVLINTTESLPNWAFFIDKGRLPQRGDFVVFNPPKTALITAHFGKQPAPFAKRALGVPGDLVTRRGNAVLINGETVATLKPRTKRGETLLPGPTGRIPERCYYLGTAHPDGFDSRYAEIGFVCADRIVGTGDALL